MTDEEYDEGGDPTARIVATLRTWAGISTVRRRDGSVAFHLGPREVGRVHDAGVVDVALPAPARDRLVESGRVAPERTSRESGRASYYLPDHPMADGRDGDPPTVEEALWLLRVAYLSNALSLSHTPPGGEVLASIEVEPELRDLDLDPSLAAAFDDLRNR